ncbi:hypothetical protein FO519_003533 [Halicephalobus sp. NKZ332]|nr:hypothetical protein FO519_003533 [Halicephalobus sp. NKZ332]
MNYFLFYTVIFFTTALCVSGFTLETLIGEAHVSHSGPTNSLYGHERFYDDPHDEHDRVKRDMYSDKPQEESLDGDNRVKRGIYYNRFSNWNNRWNKNWNNNWNNNQWPDLRIASEPPNEYLKMWLTSEHNRYRQLVPATNMRMLYWSEELAASAQRHADRCDFRHSRDRVNVGENIWAAPYANYSDAITRWFQEVNNPWCGCNHAYKHCCGHYIQVVWAQTNLVGCGFSRCRDIWGLSGRGHRNVFVCHYNPQGNTVFVNGNGQLYAVPAFKWATSNKERCSECPPDAPACYKGLCYKPSDADRLFGQSRNETTSDQQTTSSPENEHQDENPSQNQNVNQNENRNENQSQNQGQNQNQSYSRRPYWYNNNRSYYKQKTHKEPEAQDDVRR